MSQRAVPGQPGMYVSEGKRRSRYFARINNEYVQLGYDLAAAKLAMAKLLELPHPVGDIRSMCLGYIAEQRALLKAGDSAALALSTIDDYEQCLERFVLPVFGTMRPDDFKSSHAARYLAENRKLKRAVRANREMAALSSAFNYGMANGFCDTNPCRGVRRNKERPRTRAVAVAELNAFLAHAKAKGGSAYLVALIGCTVALSGRRRAEILRLPRPAMTDAGFKVKDSKTKAGEPERFYFVEWSPILRQVVAEVNAIKRHVPSIFVFATLEGQPYTDQGFKCLWNRLMHSYAPNGPASPEWFRAHDLRALYVSEMLDQGRDPNTHKNEETMRRVYDRRHTIKVSPLA